MIAYKYLFYVYIVCLLHPATRKQKCLKMFYSLVYKRIIVTPERAGRHSEGQCHPGRVGSYSGKTEGGDPLWMGEEPLWEDKVQGTVKICFVPVRKTHCCHHAKERIFIFATERGRTERYQ